MTNKEREEGLKEFANYFVMVGGTLVCIGNFLHLGRKDEQHQFTEGDIAKVLEIGKDFIKLESNGFIYKEYYDSVQTDGGCFVVSEYWEVNDRGIAE